MPRRKALKVGEEVVIIQGRKWYAPSARTTVVESISPRHLKLKAIYDPISKDFVVRRTETAEKLGRYIDMLDKLEAEFDEARLEALRPVNQKFSLVMDPIREEITELYSAVKNER